MPQIPTLLELLHAGVHFGHRTSKSYPKMAPYIFTQRGGVHILNVEITQKKLEEALNFVRNLVAQKGVIVFVGSKKQAQSLIKEAGLSCGMPYVNDRWLGGTLTNFGIISKLIQKFKNLKKKRESGELVKYTKKEQLEFDREIERLEKLVGGISSLEKLPDALFLVDLKREKTALSEAKGKGIPIIALCDTNVNPEYIDYPIPSNDDATKALSLMIGLMVAAVQEGKEELSKKEEEKKSIPGPTVVEPA
jgi:small subunit ribosomal protein S2